MKDYILLTAILLTFLATFHPELEAANPKAKIAWQTNYQKALQEAQEANKPILLFFTGSDWCTWCKKLEKEVFTTPEFAQTAGSGLIFVMLDYPIKHSVDAKTSEQNQALKNKYLIKSYPTVILINGNEELMGTTGYRPGGGKKYAQHLSQIIKEHAGQIPSAS